MCIRDRASTTPESGNCNPTRKFPSREERSGDLETEEIARQTMLMARVVAKRISNWLEREPGNLQIVLTNQVTVSYTHQMCIRDRATPSDINPNSNLLGVGPGLRYAITPYLSLRFDYGFQMIDTGLGNGEHSRAHVGVVVSY